jgi:hypothetical protein
MNAKRLPLQVADFPEAAEGAACTLLPGALNGRRVELREVLALATGCAESAQGFVISFPPTDDVARAVCDAVLAERVCCAHFRYILSFMPGDPTFSLTVEARDDYVAPLKALYTPLLGAAGHHG